MPLIRGKGGKKGEGSGELKQSPIYSRRTNHQRQITVHFTGICKLQIRCKSSKDQHCNILHLQIENVCFQIRFYYYHCIKGKTWATLKKTECIKKFHSGKKSLSSPKKETKLQQIITEGESVDVFFCNWFSKSTANEYPLWHRLQRHLRSQIEQENLFQKCSRLQTIKWIQLATHSWYVWNDTEVERIYLMCLFH